MAERTADRNRLWLRSEALLMVARFDGQIVAVNPAWTATLGWSEAETVGHRLAAFACADDVQRVADIGGRLIVSPNTDPEVIREMGGPEVAKRLGL